MQDIKLQRQDLFPTRVWSFDLDFLRPHYAAWEEAILRWRGDQQQPAGRSNRGGWNSDKSVMAMELFAPLRQAAEQCFGHAFQEMQLRAPLSFMLEGWVNLHDQGGFNTLHVHPNVLLCGSFYLRAPDGAGPLVFRDPRAGVVLSPFDGSGANCVSQTAVQPAEGQLLIFPNWLDHRVEPNEAAQPRISIGINALAAGAPRQAGQPGADS